jgi:hypothetical protein
MNLRNYYFIVTIALAIFLIFSIVAAKPTAQELKMQKAQLEQQKFQQLGLTEKDMPWVRNPEPLYRHGGPDAGGYYYIDSDDDAMNKPVYNWVDISGVGTPVSFTNGTLDDGWSNAIDMGMTFNFYGADYTTFAVTTNGMLGFGSLASSYLSNYTIPTSGLPNAFVAVEWDDMDARSGGTCYYYYDAGENRFIVSWTDWSYYPASSGPNAPHNFQVILYAGTNNIVCQYGDMDGAWQADVTEGIENESGTVGTLYAYNNAVTTTGLAIYYGQDGPIFGTHNVGPMAFIAPGMYGMVGQAVTPQVRFRNIGASSETFPVRLQVREGANLLYNQTATVTNLPSNGTTDVTFPNFTPASEAIYTMTAISELGTDENRLNDTLHYTFQAFNQIVYLDFEGDGVYAPTGDWEWGTPTIEPDAAHSGVSAWGTTLGGDYPASDLATLTSEEYSLGVASVLKFWQWYETEPSYDGGNVKITTDNGSTWELIHPNEGYTGQSNTSNPLSPDSIFTGYTTGGNTWHEVTFDLTAYNNQTVQFRFDFGSDASVQYSGWTIDDFTLLGAGTYAHNVGPMKFLAPGLYGQAGDAITPVVIFRNTGENTETFPVRLQIYQGVNLVYNQTGTVTSLPVRGNDTLSFPNYTPATEGLYTLVAISELVGDLSPANDTVRTEFRVYTEMASYDFEADGVFTPEGDWEWGTPTGGPGSAHSGVSCWGTALSSGTYPASDNATLTTTPFGIGPNALLTFWHWYETENRYDGGNVKVSSDGGGSWELLHPMNGYDDTSYAANPLYPDSIFTDESGNWIQSTFDLSSYSGVSLLFRFDFGSDGSVQYSGWYIDDLAVLGGGGVEPGWITGTVSNLAGGTPVNGAIVMLGHIADTTGADGIYWLRTYPGTYPVTASAQFHNSTTSNVTVVENDTVTQNFALTAPGITVDNTAIHDTLLVPNTRAHVRTIGNPGNGALDFTVSINYSRLLRPGNIHKTPISGFDNLISLYEKSDKAPTFGNIDPPVRDDFGDEVFTFDPETPTADVYCLGIEFDGVHFWVTGANVLYGDHKIHKFDNQGNYIESYSQGNTSQWGWRDLVFDGEYLYGSDESGIYQIDTTGNVVGTIPAPSGFTLPCRALAYDPATNHFWTANYTSNIVEFDRDGNTISDYSNELNVYGMAWDAASVDGPWLWTFSQDGTPAMLVSQFDPRLGTYTGVSFYAIDHGGSDASIAGGACFTTQYDPSLGVLFCLVQGSGTTDMVQGYEITPYSTWLTVDPRSGSVAAGGNTPLTITCDLSNANLANDTTFMGTVVISNNSATTPQIPVTLRALTSGIDDITILPNNYSLFQNYPNPFNSQTLINFALPKESQVDLSVYNILGQKVATLVSGKLEAGFHQVKWDASNVATGVYYYKIIAGDYTKIQQMTLLK